MSFDKDYEIKVLSAAFHDEEFFPSRGYHINAKFFAVPAHRKLWFLWQEFFTKYAELPTEDSLIQVICKANDDYPGFWSDADSDYIPELLKAIGKEYDNVQFTIDGFQGWVQKQALEQGVTKLVEGVAEGELTDPSQAHELLMQGDVSKLFQANEVETDFSKLLMDHIIERQTLGDDDILPIGLRELDDALGGGSKRGYKNIIMGPPGGGKTTAVTKMCAHLIDQGMNVVYFFNDDTQREILDRFGAILSGIGIDELADQHNFSELERLVAKLKKSRGTLNIQYIDPTVTPFQLEQIVAKLAKKHGRIDRVVVDHIRNLSPDASLANKRGSDSWERIGHIFLGLQSIPIKHGCDLWAVAHTKKDAEGKDWIGQDQMGLSYEPIKDANIVMSAWRLKQDQFKHTGQPDAMRFQIAKRRGGPGLGERLRYEVDFPTHTFEFVSWDKE